jgi:hypothetical protein
MTQARNSWSTYLEVPGIHYFGWRLRKAQQQDLQLRTEMCLLDVDRRRSRSSSACKGKGISRARVGQCLGA